MNVPIQGVVDRCIHERHPTDLQVRVTEIEDREFSASGQVIEISDLGIGVYLPLQFKPGSAVQLDIKDSVLYGFILYSTPERSYFRTGIEVVQVLMVELEPSQSLAAIRREVPNVERLEMIP
jgi:hypothetical protein